MSSLPFWSPLEVILPHWHILNTEQEERDGLQATAELPHHLNHNICAAQYTHSSVDLPILISHAVSVVQVCKRLGCSPGLQVAGHPDWGSHLCSVYSVSGTIMMLWTPTLHLDKHGNSLILLHLFQCPIHILLCVMYVLLYLWVDDQISDDSVFLKVGVSFMSIPIFHLIGTIQVLQCHWGDVDSPGNEHFNQWMVFYEY